MNDRRNILASLMQPRVPAQQETLADAEDRPADQFVSQARATRANSMDRLRSSGAIGSSSARNNPNNLNLLNLSSNLARPTSGASSGTTGKQHKLKQRFTVIRKLGKGTYGKVQLAINKETGQEVAIKTIKKTKIETEQDLERVRREIQIMSSIEHPHIIHIYEVFENKDKIVLVMQYAPGGELFEHVSQSKILDDQEARRLFRQIATAIFYCHQNKICHRDLKLENILLDEKSNAKLADFGLSNVFDKHRQLKTFCGSPLYASPEIVQGSPYEGPEVDCWSLGVLLYTLVYGAMPFDGSNFKRLVKQISDGCYAEPKQKSSASPLIRRLLCADPNKRANIVDICMDSWVNGAIPASPRSPRSPLADSTSDSNRRNSPAGQPAPTCLLKVAQDMAKLTPVRLDMLLALTPSAPGEPAEAQAEPESAHEAPMEVDENRVGSPIASYIVRDFDEQPESEQRELEQTKDVCATAEPVAQEPLEEAKDEVLEHPAEMADIQVDTQQEDPQAAEVCMEETGLTVGLEDVAIGEQSQSEPVKLAMEAEEKDRVAQEEVRAEPARVEETTGVYNAPEQPREKTERAPENDTEREESVAPERGEERPTDEEKPKKVKKKKIIVVKKKKKVAKKESDADNKEEDEQHAKDKLTIDSETTTANVTPERTPNRSPKPKGPGKVRIPDTFQGDGENAGDSQTPSRTSLEVRRTSALVSDVSQRLLQQLQASGGHSGGQMSSDELQQLAGVRVSDKKGEFERRASQVSTEVEHSLAGPKEAQAQRTSSLVEEEGEPVKAVDDSANELVQTESLREILKVLDVVERQTSELIDKQEPQRVEQVAKLVEPIRTSAEELRDTLDVEQTGDERSDSVETIKPEREELSSPPRIRSSLQLDLTGGSAGEPVRASPIGQAQLVGPAPIARSYKKVTFTKDGACVTETGKIYSTLADDGTVRRVKRKSKVTHYPANCTDDIRGPRQRQEEQEEEEEIEEEILSDGGSARVWRERQTFHSSSLAAPSASQQKPFERLIMPTLADSLFAEQSDDGFRPFSRESQPLGRADSASSCSSGSTDVLDDIFDTWTGAISMFDRKSRLSGMHSSLIGRVNDPFKHPLFAHHRSPRPTGFTSLLADHQPAQQFQQQPQQQRRRQHKGRWTSSLAGTPRCESVEPQFPPRSRLVGEQRQQQQQRSDRWASMSPDAGQWTMPERPASALSSARGMFGSSSLLGASLFEAPEDPVSGAEQLLRNLELEHQNIRQRIARQHKQLWKGSTPSLFEPSDQLDLDQRVDELGFSPRSGRVGSQLEHRWTEELAAGGRQRSSSGAQSCSGQMESPWRPVHKLHSRPPASPVRQSTPLDASPLRRPQDGHQLPPRQQPMQKSASKTSVLVSSQSASKCADSKQITSASFIELKRTSSASQQQQQPQQMSSSSSFDQQATPTVSTSDCMLPDGSPSISGDNLDARVRTWLQESSSNLSISSGSKSSTSDTMRSLGNRADLIGSFSPRLSKLGPQEQLIGLPPIASVRAQTQSSKMHQQQHMVHSGGNTGQATTSATSTFVISSTSSSSLHNKQQQQQIRQKLLMQQVEPTGEQIVKQEEMHEIRRQTTVDSGVSTMLGGQLGSTNSSNRLSRATITLRDPLLTAPSRGSDGGRPVGAATASSSQSGECNQQQVQVSTSSSSFSRVSPSIHQSATKLIGGQADSDALQWIHTSNSRLFADDQEDSLSGSAELESPSSSSLLEQLRSRGYRSMINQRLVGDLHQMQSASQPPLLASLRPGAAETTSASTSARIVTTTVSNSSLGAAETTQTVVHHQIISDSSKMVRAQLDEFSDEQSVANKREDSEIDASKGNSPPQEGPSETANSDPQLADQPSALPELSAAPEEPKVQAEDEEEMDEDVREAKKNVKLYLDRMKETELFLKSINEEEQKLEKERKESFVLNNLLISAKLNGFRAINGQSQYISSLHYNSPPLASLGDPLDIGGFRSAPTRSVSHDIEALASPALSFEPTYTIPSQFGQSSASSTSTSYLQSRRVPKSEPLHLLGTLGAPTMSLARAQDPLEPVQPFMGHTSYSSYTSDALDESRPMGVGGRRSRSQLSDQFADYSSRRQHRPTSADVVETSSNPYFPSRAKRSVSQVRYPTSNRYSQPAMSEYRSAYGGVQATTALPDRTSPVESPANHDYGTSLEFTRDTHESDDDMSAYRPSAYVPRVVPQGVSTRGRKFEMPSTDSSSSRWTSSGSRLADSGGERKSRRTSLQALPISSELSKSSRESPDSSPVRRRTSLTTNDELQAACKSGETNSRLEELEKRIQQNKRRREELLSGRVSPRRNETDAPVGSDLIDTGTTNDPDSPRSATLAAGRAAREMSPARFSRPSRLESMEARIKRKSYCVRMGDCSPERAGLLRKQPSLERWRQSNTRSSAVQQTVSSSPRNSVASLDFGSLLESKNKTSRKECDHERSAHETPSTSGCSS